MQHTGMRALLLSSFKPRTFVLDRTEGDFAELAGEAGGGSAGVDDGGEAALEAAVEGAEEAALAGAGRAKEQDVQRIDLESGEGRSEAPAAKGGERGAPGFRRTPAVFGTSNLSTSCMSLVFVLRKITMHGFECWQTVSSG